MVCAHVYDYICNYLSPAGEINASLKPYTNPQVKVIEGRR